MTSCLPCPGGHQCPLKTVAEPCDPGKYASNQTLSCQNCPKGSMCPGSENIEPTPCPTGSYQESTSQTSCTVCQTGYKCPLKTEVGTKCPIGFYQDLNGQTSCKAVIESFLLKNVYFYKIKKNSVRLVITLTPRETISVPYAQQIVTVWILH